MALIPSGDVSEEDIYLGAVGAFGFEFFFTQGRRGSYFIELGGVGTAAEADKLDRSPVFANGFMTNVGVRYYF